MCGLVHITPALAAAPPVVAQGFTQQLSSSLTFTANIGSPAAGELDVLIADCYDLTLSNATVIGTPSGWTKEFSRQAGDTFGDHAVFWKVASGSEGATVGLGVSNNSTECSASYFRFTGYDSTNPIDCTDPGAWATSLTFDPVSLSFASAPRDAVAIAFAHTRGDSTYSSGPAMGTNLQSANPGIAAGRSVAIGYSSVTATSSFDPGVVTFGGTARLGSSITCAVYAPVAGGQASLLNGLTSKFLGGKVR